MEALPKSFTFESIGFFRSSKVNKYDADRQPKRPLATKAPIQFSVDDLSPPPESYDEVVLHPGKNFEQALSQIESCSHIWIVYVFHLNQDWKPMVQPPRGDQKVGVFSSRAPYRPCPIGISSVQLVQKDGLILQVGANDILDGSPILDIKPYHPESDLIEDAKIGWLESALNSLQKFNVSFSPVARDQIDFLYRIGIKELEAFVSRQLETEPTDFSRKRVSQNGPYWTLSYRTWRIDFVIVENVCSVLGIRSGYTPIEMDVAEDRYSDKEIHRQFRKTYEN